MKRQLSIHSLSQQKDNKRPISPQRPYSPIKNTSINSQTSPFYTQIKTKPFQDEQLQNYISCLRKQIKNAVWKQQLILQYNYMPLQSIKQKIQFQKQAYQNKMDLYKEEYLKMFQNQQFTEELQNLRKFNIKLKQKMKDFECKIQEIKIKNSIIKTDADKKRQRLKQLIKGNMQLSKNYVQKLGATNKQDIIRLVKAKSQRQLHQRRPSLQLNKLTQIKNTLIQRSQSAKIIKSTMRKSLFQQCLVKLITEIKYMSKSSDIQQGIYLQIMNKKKIQFSNAGKMSHKSTINNTLLQRYGTKIHKRGNAHYEENDFEMEWGTFKQLNWKQLLGIVLVKDPNCNKLKNIFKKIDLKNIA